MKPIREGFCYVYIGVDTAKPIRDGKKKKMMNHQRDKEGGKGSHHPRFLLKTELERRSDKKEGT